jgi:hypothetical protein
MSDTPYMDSVAEELQELRRHCDDEMARLVAAMIVVGARLANIDRNHRRRAKEVVDKLLPGILRDAMEDKPLH